MEVKLKGLSDEETAQLVLPGTILFGYRGSIAHGMYVPNSDPNSVDDKDLMGVCVPGEAQYFGLHRFEQKEMFYKEWDTVTYEAHKFISLLAKQNPNVLSMLWLDRKYVLLETEGGRLLRENRHLFVSRKAYHSFVGYALSQLKKMTHSTCQGYMGEKRKRLVQQFGYDTKNAAHLLRLLRMGIEFLRDGVLYVDRGVVGDATYLLDVKRGEWKLEQVKAEADRLFKRAEEAYDRSQLAADVDHEAVNDLAIRVVKLELARQGVAA